MKKLVLTLCTLIYAVSSTAQSNDFSTSFRSIYDACLKARSSLSDGIGSPSEMKQACKNFNAVKWSMLKLQSIDVKNEVPMDNHLVFLPNFFSDLIKDHLIYKKAAWYQQQAEGDDNLRGYSDVKITTRAVKAKSSVTYRIQSSGTLEIAVVSETNGLVSWLITVESSEKKSIMYKDNKKEYKGTPSRFKRIKLPQGVCFVTIKITNTTSKASSYAIITNN